MHLWWGYSFRSQLMNVTYSCLCKFKSIWECFNMEKMTCITFKLHRQALLSVSTISLKHNIDYFPTTNLSLVGRDVNHGLGDHAGFELPGSVDASEEVGWCWDSGQLRRGPLHPSHQALQGNRSNINSTMT